MKIAHVLFLFTFLIANSAAAATALPDAEKHRLASYLAYITVGVDTSGPGGESIYTVGANCPECGGPPGLVGDGTVMVPCQWDDGKFYCNKGKIAQSLLATKWTMKLMKPCVKRPPATAAPLNAMNYSTSWTTRQPGSMNHTSEIWSMTCRRL